ncbi:MAG: SDR family NAD(P)-dependent oxidoreductase, partial [Candidatus Cryptobacteroides sp.]
MEQNQGQAVAVPSGWFIVTGANGSIGLEVVKGLLARGYSVIMACRSEEKGRAAARKVIDEYPDARLRVAPLDVTSQESIAAFVGSL